MSPYEVRINNVAYNKSLNDTKDTDNMYSCRVPGQQRGKEMCCRARCACWAFAFAKSFSEPKLGD